MIEVVEHRSEWADQFEFLAERYRSALRAIPVVAIEHVGSTSVSGLAAKPVIDIDVVVERTSVPSASAGLQSIGYQPKGEQGIVDRFAFREPAASIRTNTYVVVAGSIALRNHLAVRDALRADAELRHEYAALKRHLAERTDDVGVYVEGKSALIQRVLADAGLSPEELANIEAENRPSG